MPEQIIIIPGRPIAKKRPRFARRGKFTVTYSAQETEEGRTYLEVRKQWGKSPLDCPVIVEMAFMFPITAGSKKAVKAMLDGEIKHTKKPDLDNAGKFYLDVMNQLVFQDDKQVYELALSKGYAQESQTIIKIEW
jgi:Holliday junction resolvase RusA-like endonuclease